MAVRPDVADCVVGEDLPAAAGDRSVGLHVHLKGRGVGSGWVGHARQCHTRNRHFRWSTYLRRLIGDQSQFMPGNPLAAVFDAGADKLFDVGLQQLGE